jgi:hypothetical protein
VQKTRKFYNANSASPLGDFPARDFGRNKRCIQINIPLQTKLKQACCECCRDCVVVDEHQRLSNKMTRLDRLVAKYLSNCNFDGQTPKLWRRLGFAQKLSKMQPEG